MIIFWRIAAVLLSYFRTKNGTHTTLTLIPNLIKSKRDNMALQLKKEKYPFKNIKFQRSADKEAGEINLDYVNKGYTKENIYIDADNDNNTYTHSSIFNTKL